MNELEPLLEVNTDKVDTEIPAPASGTVLKIMAEEGVAAKVGAVLAFIGKPGEVVDHDGANGVQSLPTLEKNMVAPPTSGDVHSDTVKQGYRLPLSRRREDRGRAWREFTASTRYRAERSNHQK